jgi:hypothetical protein
MWIGDSGASCHFTNDDTGYIKWQSINVVIGVGNNDVSIATKVGKIRLEVIQRNGQRSIITLNNCKCIPELRNNLFSITKTLTMGWKIRNTGIKLVLSKHSGTEKGCIVFDTINPTTSDLVIMVKMVTLPPKYDNSRQHTDRRVTELALDMRQVGLLPRADLIPLTFNPFEIAQ